MFNETLTTQAPPDGNTNCGDAEGNCIYGGDVVLLRLYDCETKVIAKIMYAGECYGCYIAIGISYEDGTECIDKEFEDWAECVEVIISGKGAELRDKDDES